MPATGHHTSLLISEAHFLHGSPYWDRVFYTRSDGLRPPATVVGTAEDGLLHLECYQDGLRVVNRQRKLDSSSFAILSSDSPPHCPPSPPPNTQSSSPPKAPSLSPQPQEPGRSPSMSPPVQFGSPNSLVVPRLNFCLRLQCLGSFPVFVFVTPWTGLSSLIRTNKSQPRSGWRHKPKKFKISESNSPEWQ